MKSNNIHLEQDNRRLTIFRLALPSATQIPVRILTEEEADKALCQESKARKKKAKGLAARLTTKDGGYSVIIRFPDAWEVVEQGNYYCQLNAAAPVNVDAGTSKEAEVTVEADNEGDKATGVVQLGKDSKTRKEL
ncbi:hypothetical protein MVEN_00484400 [Mycena venus]|uniref:Uncharacterized protein n=1 Tax=Mycena venus TaxID=2733690 RepID=A0A8H6YXF3_9AGAR|nr:hypothetical protein MVEN_00484400 [Mycena venus]